MSATTCYEPAGDEPLDRVATPSCRPIANRGHPHGRVDGPIRRPRARSSRSTKPTSSAATPRPRAALAISANDMTRWLLTQLGRGKIPGGDSALFCEATVGRRCGPR